MFGMVGSSTDQPLAMSRGLIDSTQLGARRPQRRDDFLVEDADRVRVVDGDLRHELADDPEPFAGERPLPREGARAEALGVKPTCVAVIGSFGS